MDTSRKLKFSYLCMCRLLWQLLSHIRFIILIFFLSKLIICLVTFKRLFSGLLTDRNHSASSFSSIPLTFFDMFLGFLKCYLYSSDSGIATDSAYLGDGFLPANVLSADTARGSVVI